MLLVYGIIFALYYQFLYTTLDEEMARINGVNTKLINTLLLAIISLVIVVGVRMVGGLMITALTVLPGATACMLSRKFAGVLIASLLIGTLGTFTAVCLAIVPPMSSYDPGPIGVLTLFAIFTIVWTIRRFFKPKVISPDIEPAQPHDHAHPPAPSATATPTDNHPSAIIPRMTNPANILPLGTQIVSRNEIKAPSGHPHHPIGAVGIIVSQPADHLHAYRIRFPDGFEASLKREDFTTLREFQSTTTSPNQLAEHNLTDHIIYRCIIGSRAYGLDTDTSDTDRRGIYLPPADLHWSLYGIPEQLENVPNQECYWELQKFLTLGLKANPNILECLYSPLVETLTPLGEELLNIRQAFLSKLVYQTYNGYVLSQFKKLQSDLRNKGEVKWKHVMHLLRLLLAGIQTLQTGSVPVRIEQHRETLLSIKRGEPHLGRPRHLASPVAPRIRHRRHHHPTPRPPRLRNHQRLPHPRKTHDGMTEHRNSSRINCDVS